MLVRYILRKVLEWLITHFLKLSFVNLPGFYSFLLLGFVKHFVVDNLKDQLLVIDTCVVLFYLRLDRILGQMRN